MNKSFILSDSLYFRTMGIEVISGNPNDLTNPDVLFYHSRLHEKHSVKKILLERLCI